MVLIWALRARNPLASMGGVQGYAGEKNLGGEFGHPCSSVARPTRKGERPTGPLKNTIITTPVYGARPPYTWRSDDFSGLIPHAFCV